MFEAISSKILTGVVSLSMLLFSSFKGNDPSLSVINHRTSSSYLYLSGELLSAFDNDFSSIFASGVPIPIYFNLNIKSGNRTVVNKRFQHVVSFDPVSGVYELQKQGNPEVFRSKAVNEVIRELSLYQLSVPYQSTWGIVSVKLEAELPAVRFQELDQETDLMILWKYKKPAAKTQIDLRKAN
jgi:hypothetical protein